MANRVRAMFEKIRFAIEMMTEQERPAILKDTDKEYQGRELAETRR